MTKLEKAEKIEEMRNTISDQVDLLTEFKRFRKRIKNLGK